jgi:hypothetical protein
MVTNQPDPSAWASAPGIWWRVRSTCRHPATVSSDLCRVMARAFICVRVARWDAMQLSALASEPDRRSTRADTPVECPPPTQRGFLSGDMPTAR